MLDGPTKRRFNLSSFAILLGIHRNWDSFFSMEVVVKDWSHCLPSHTVILIYFEKIGKSCKHILTEDDWEEFDEDIKAFVNDSNLPKFNESDRIW